MIALDFFSGSHGHFLEYLVNTYIFKGPQVANVITNLGTSHNIRKDIDYMNCRIVEGRHYSEFNLTSSTPDKVIRISTNTELESVCYQINVFCRAGDIPAENKLLQIPAEILANPVQLRNDLYSKLIDCGYQLPGCWRWNDVDCFVFPMRALYNINELYQSLYQLAHFLKHSFNPDDSLYKLWRNFMEKNHGWQYWTRANNILEKILANENYTFTADTWLQALINYLLTRTIGIADGVLFDHAEYPTNTSVIYQIIQQHIDNFDQKFKNQI